MDQLAVLEISMPAPADQEWNSLCVYTSANCLRWLFLQGKN
jgi:hypothetical protein